MCKPAPFPKQGPLVVLDSQKSARGSAKGFTRASHAAKLAGENHFQRDSMEDLQRLA